MKLLDGGHNLFLFNFTSKSCVGWLLLSAKKQYLFIYFPTMMMMMSVIRINFLPRLSVLDKQIDKNFVWRTRCCVRSINKNLIILLTCWRCGMYLSKIDETDRTTDDQRY